MSNNVANIEWITPYCGLPALDLQCEEQLKRLNINYVVRDYYCIIFDPNVVQYSIEVLTEKRLATSEMEDAAYQYYKQKEVYEKIELPFRRKEFDELFEATSKDGISIYWIEDDMTISAEEMDSKYFLFDLHHVCSDYFYGLVILKSKVKQNQVLPLTIPSFIMGDAIGRQGKNAKRLAKELGVKFVKFVSSTDY